MILSLSAEYFLLHLVQLPIVTANAATEALTKAVLSFSAITACVSNRTASDIN
jgi:hypothetical protein